MPKRLRGKGRSGRSVLPVGWQRFSERGQNKGLPVGQTNAGKARTRPRTKPLSPVEEEGRRRGIAMEARLNDLAETNRARRGGS